MDNKLPVKNTVKNIGRIHIEEEELSRLLGFDGGRIRYFGWMPEYGEIGIVIEHPDMPGIPLFGCIPQVERRSKMCKPTEFRELASMVTAYKRGHLIKWLPDRREWVYADNGSQISTERPCIHCGLMPTSEGHDACIGHIPGVTSACCGHGVEDPYVIRKEGKVK